MAALRFLTEALYAAVHYHGCVADYGDRSVVSLLGPRDPAARVGEALGQELMPCRPEDPAFEPRLKALLRRHVVERCIYGVDLDPLAVELCRLALWIETMDRTLPFSFLDHKIKCGNALVGAWCDTFQHYPVMAFKNREGGDKGHGNGVHFEKDARGKELREFAAGPLKDDLARLLSGPTLFDQREQAAEVDTVHDDALALLARLHDLPVHDTAERARLYRDELLGATAYRRLKDAMDLWCACWFWPADELSHAPLPRTLAAPPEAARSSAARIAAGLRFFHWELEFPDVFRVPGAGFDAVLGNPPWDIAKPNSKEFFSNIDPLYRAYGKQEALRAQTGYFADANVERQWLDYNADFRAESNFMKYAAGAFGNPTDAEASLDRFNVARGHENNAMHERWRAMRSKSHGYAASAHPFRHQGSADINLYKAFLEAAHALLRNGGRFGFIVPSGLYSDHGTGALRRLFLDHCGWEWLFGFENREKIFDIDSRFKFNPVIIEKGGRTEAIRTAFMRRALTDWERAEALAVPYASAQVGRFSPKSRAILEIQSARDLEILEKIYANSVLLGDNGPDSWGVKYATEFHMTNDSKLFPPRPVWEAKGYRPDEYSRWLLGGWRPIKELWAELGVDPSRVVPADLELEEWLFDATAGPESRAVEARFAYSHQLKPGDVARTLWRLRCAQPPYDALPIPRADIPAGIILSRAVDSWIREDEVKDVALPLYQGRMIWQLHHSSAGWVGPRSTDWRKIDPWDATVDGQFLMSTRDWGHSGAASSDYRLGFRDVQNATNQRTLIAAIVPGAPCGNKVPTLMLPTLQAQLELLSSMVSYPADRALRAKMSQGTVNWFYVEEVPVVRRLVLGPTERARRRNCVMAQSACSARFAPIWLALGDQCIAWRSGLSVLLPERVRMRASLDALDALHCGMSFADLAGLLRDCDRPIGNASASRLDPKGFWRVDKELEPERRHTVLSLIAFANLEEHCRAAGGDDEAGIEAFLCQNGGEGWLLPETLRLSDYGLGHDERARSAQAVANCLGPRLCDWQLVQTSEESWRECHLHGRNLLGQAGYKQLVAQIQPSTGEDKPDVATLPTETPGQEVTQSQLFE